MTEQTLPNLLTAILRQHPDGITGIALQQQAKLTESDFLTTARRLWDEAQLAGVTKQGCCHNRCSFACVAYMDMDYLWKLSRRGS